MFRKDLYEKMVGEDPSAPTPVEQIEGAISKYSLLKNEEDLTETQKIKLEAIKENFQNLKKMQELKEEFRKIYETSENPTEGMLSFLLTSLLS